MGKGSAGLHAVKETSPGHERPVPEANLTAGSTGASNSEEPGAVIPHAGICAGAAGQLAVLP